MSNIEKIRKVIGEKFNVVNPNIIELDSDMDSNGDEILRFSFIFKNSDYSIELYLDGEIDIFKI